ncbi:MAG: putative membrane protein [Polaribacter sp.]|jgi:uncharacterized membrane protein
MSIAIKKPTTSPFKKFINSSFWVLVVILAIAIGLYPLTFLEVNHNKGLLSHKTPELLANLFWNLAFYIHISLGGFALLIGWSLFLKKFRSKKLHLHRLIGKIYIIAVLLSSISGLYVAYHATGGIFAKLGFAGMAIAWFVCTYIPYKAIRNKNIQKHERWMIRSYAVTFTGVTFRLWMPFLIAVCQLEFLNAYPIASWVSWIANLFVAQLIIKNRFGKKKKYLKLNTLFFLN